MSNNAIERLHTSSFANLPEIVNITLNNMPTLKVIEKYAFVNLPKLRYLSLTNNPNLIHIGGKVNSIKFYFSIIQKMFKIVHCFNNNLNPVQAFGHSIPNIRTLMLSNNGIEILPEEIRSNLLRLQKLDLQGNPLRCDCHLAWIEEIPELVGEPKCSIPREYAG